MFVQNVTPKKNIDSAKVLSGKIDTKHRYYPTQNIDISYYSNYIGHD